MTSPSLTDKALRLASWKKPCPGLAYGSEDFMHGSDCPFNCTDGEIYVLDASVRVECEYQRRMGAFHDEGPNGCVTCQGRGWVALDPRFGWDWMMALAKAGFASDAYNKPDAFFAFFDAGIAAMEAGESVG